jgi:hypothetical protein
VPSPQLLWGGKRPIGGILLKETFEMIAIAIERLRVAREHKDTIYLELCIISLTHALQFLQRHLIVARLPEPELLEEYPNWD